MSLQRPQPRRALPSISFALLLFGCSGADDSPSQGSSGTSSTGGAGGAPSPGAAGGAGVSGSAGSNLTMTGGAGMGGGSAGDTSNGGNAGVAGTTAAGAGGTGGTTGVGGASGAAGAGGSTPGGTKIFDGMTLSGWTSKPAGMFTVMDGILQATGKGRGTFATTSNHTHFRVLFSVHPGGTGGHAPTVLIFCNYPDKDALGSIQFQPPNGGRWDYRPGKNNDGGALFTKIGAPGPALNGWTTCELIANAGTGEAKMACGGKDVLHFRDPTAGQGMAAPFALQTHNAGITDGYNDLSIEDNLTSDDYVSVK